MEFKNWLEWADFGFEKVKAPSLVDGLVKKEDPVHPFDIEELFTYLAMRKLGPHNPNAKFVNEMVWGNGVGAMRVIINSDLQAMIDKKGIDLAGNERWLTKRLFQVNRDGYGGFESIVADEIYEELENSYHQPLDVASSDYRELERLVVGLAAKMQKVAKDIFMFENIVKIDDNRYIIVFNYRGAGAGGPGNRKEEENLTEVIYNKEDGTIRIFNFNVESDNGRNRSWEITPSDKDFYFFPSQDKNEILEVLAVPMKYY